MRLLPRRRLASDEGRQIEWLNLPTTESMPVVRCGRRAVADGMDEQQTKPVPAIFEADEREEAGYGV